ncbi:MAG: cytochrome c peroxidase [Chitinophagaceae bacterium]
MKKLVIVGSLATIVCCLLAFQRTETPQSVISSYFYDSLRALYERPVKDWPGPFVDDSIHWKELSALPASPYSKDSSLKDIVELGKYLFFDPRLSGSNQISCASCHEPELGWSNGRTVGVGHDHQLGTRNVPSLFNAWYAKKFFWDGRADSLEQQAVAPISNDLEMHEFPGKLEDELANVPFYKEKFTQVFGKKHPVTINHIMKAIAMYERTITSRPSPFDAFVTGKYTAMTDQQVWGLHLFRTKARCMNCHNGPMFTDEGFHNIGLAYYGRKYEDLGLYNITRKKEDVGKFKTPSLRDVALTRPYMHNGLFEDLEGIVNIYNVGGARTKRKPEQANDTLFPETSAILKPLQLTKEEKEAVVAFLHSISTSTSYRVPRPALP